MNNKLKKIQDTMIKEIDRLDNCEENISNEVARSNALSNNAITFIKSINLQLRIKEVAQKSMQSVNNLNKDLGINE